jgi:hypothetical protein
VNARTESLISLFSALLTRLRGKRERFNMALVFNYKLITSTKQDVNIRRYNKIQRDKKTRQMLAVIAALAPVKLVNNGSVIKQVVVR